MNFPAPLLLTNDDGYGAPGLAALCALAGPDAWVVAPRDPHSGCSHLTSMERPVAVEQVGERAYAVDGTPVDCVRVALKVLGLKPALVLSGINAGANLGHDVYLSGTVAAAREAAFFSVPSVAVSQYFLMESGIDWAASQAAAARALAEVLARPAPPGGFWNVNLPAGGGVTATVRTCPRCIRPLPIEYRQENGVYAYQRGRYPLREQLEGTDVAACFSGDIAVTWESL
jgi:5'-nucleotidase